MIIITVVVFTASASATTQSTSTTSTSTSLNTTARQCRFFAIIMKSICCNKSLGSRHAETVPRAYCLAIRYSHLFTLYFGTFWVALLIGYKVCDCTNNTVIYIVLVTLSGEWRQGKICIWLMKTFSTLFKPFHA